MKPTTRRRWMWAVLLVLLLPILAMYAFWWLVGAKAGGRGPEPGVRWTAAPAAPAALSAAEPAASMPASAAARRIAPTTAPLPAGSIAVCGDNPISVVNNSLESMQLLFGRQSRAVARAQERLTASPSPRLQAAGRMLAEVRAEAEGLQASFLAGQACDGSLACRTEAYARGREAVRAATHEQVSALALLASRQSDPAVYALAAQRCHKRNDEPAGCAQVSLARWAQLEPDNMAPWLLLAERAQRRREDAGIAEALHRASLATHHRHHEGLLFDAVRLVAPDVGSAVGEFTLHASALGVVHGNLAELSTTTGWCDAPALADANRRQTCDALATALVDRGSSMLDVTAGQAIGTRLGWPAERLAALADERLAAVSVLRPPLLGGAEGGPLSCAALASARDFFQAYGELGEWGMARAALRRSGLDPKRVADEVRAKEAWGRRQREAMAASASAPDPAASAGDTAFPSR